MTVIISIVPFFKCEALLVLGISARRRTDGRTYLLASTLLQIFKDFTLIKDRGFLINDCGFRTPMSLCTPIFKTPYSRTVTAIKGGDSWKQSSLSETSRLEGLP